MTRWLRLIPIEKIRDFRGRSQFRSTRFPKHGAHLANSGRPTGDTVRVDIL
jgi:hypothetical protein